MKGKKILINAGPTREPIDPVRFISNYSSGKMGVAVAECAADYGADVELVTGPVEAYPVNKRIKIIKVSTAAEMTEECISRFPHCDVAILAAAVADFTPEIVEKSKIRRGRDEIVLRLKPTIDIASELGKSKKGHQVLAGFALETSDEIPNAKAKLKRKNFDFIILNSLQDEGAGFGFDTNRITIIDKNNIIDKFELKSKKEAARDILNKVLSLIKNISE